MAGNFVHISVKFAVLMWTAVNANNRDRYAAYQEQTSRPIPVVAISPT